MNESGMEVDEIENQGCKFARISNGFDSNKGDKQYGDVKRSSGLGGLCGWPSSSRIVRVSRASGGKDRHSKVLTSKGLRDRRVRLSVNTAIQFYDLQDLLGYDQPSKAVEWLLKAAAPSISELPSLDGFSDAAEEQVSEDKRSSAEQGCRDSEMEGDPNYQHQPHEQLSKSACSSTSETSRGSSGLSLSRSVSRVKARERARERAVEKEKENESSRTAQHHNMTSSFTELLTGGMTSNANPTSNGSGNENKSPQQWSSSPFELLGLRGTDNSTSGLQAQIHLGNAIQQQQPRSVSSPMFSITGDHHPELHHFPFVSDRLVTAAAGETNSHGNNHYNLNFSISSSTLAGYNRGTLQSNSSSSSQSSLWPPFQRYSPVEGSQSFFNGNHQHFLSAYDARLQLFYGDGQHSDVKGRGKN